MKFSSNKLTSTVKPNTHDLMARRQNANYERFMQQKADIFQVTEKKAQAMFWTMN